jgi:hypothetical protein
MLSSDSFIYPIFCRYLSSIYCVFDLGNGHKIVIEKDKNYDGFI